MDYESARFWSDIGQWTFNAIVAAYLWVVRRHQATCDQVKMNERKIVQLRADFNSLPNRSEFVDLSKEIRSLSNKLSETKGRLGGINRAVDLINEYLINKGSE